MNHGYESQNHHDRAMTITNLPVSLSQSMVQAHEVLGFFSLVLGCICTNAPMYALRTGEQQEQHGQNEEWEWLGVVLEGYIGWGVGEWTSGRINKE